MAWAAGRSNFQNRNGSLPLFAWRNWQGQLSEPKWELAAFFSRGGTFIGWSCQALGNGARVQPEATFAKPLNQRTAILSFLIMRLVKALRVAREGGLALGPHEDLKAAPRAQITDCQLRGQTRQLSGVL